MPQAPEISTHKGSVMRPAIVAIAAGLIASTLAAPSTFGTHPWAPIRHPGRQRTVAPVRAEHPIHYPRSARSTQGAAPADKLLDEFFELHTATAYEKAAVVAERLVEIAPARADAHYNLACVMGRLRRADEALSSLERAVEHGWRDLVHLSIDPDLDSVRATVRYQALVEQLRRSGDGNGRVGDPVRPWPARVNELQRSVPALLARNGVHAATIAIVEDGVVVWSATFASGPRDAALTAGPIEAGAAVRLLALTALLRHGEPWTSLTDTGRDAQIRLAANPAAVPLESRIIRTVEDATGERFVDCCRRHVLEPLAMVDTRIAVPTGTRLSAPYGPPGTFLSAPYGPPGRHSLSYAAGNSFPATDRTLASLSYAAADSSAAADRASWAVTTTAGDLGRLLEAICGATRDRPPAGWLDLAAQLGLDAWVDGRTEAVFLELSQPSGGGVIVLRWSPRLGRAVVVVTGRGDNGGTAGRIAALALGRG